jgi:DNA-binding GntR family transcriptional regulator
MRQAIENKPITMRQRVREGIQHLIVQGKCRPGERLVQQRLAKKFGVGQGVVREALCELQMSGLVEPIDNRGVYVSELGEQTLLEAYSIRGLHEGLAARLCCDHISRAEIRDLRDLADSIYKSGQEKDYEQMGKLDKQFHNEILHKSGNSLLVRLVESYSVLQKIIRLNRNPEETYKEHMQILDAMDSGHADEACRLMQEHIGNGKQQLEKQIAEGTFVPNWIKNDNGLRRKN